MRGEERRQRAMLMIMELGDRVPREHPLRRVKELADAALAQLSPLFDEMYSLIGRPSIPPERLLKASLLMALYSVRSERMLCEQLGYNLLFRYFLDLDLIEEPFDHSSFSRNRSRLLAHEVAAHFFAAVTAQARAFNLLSDEHFTVDGSQIEAWASIKSYRPKDPPSPGTGGRGPRMRDRFESITDPQARLYRTSKSRVATLSYLANALMDNRHGLLTDLQVGIADGFCEREQALAMLA